jgi:hypothetical protein
MTIAIFFRCQFYNLTEKCITIPVNLIRMVCFRMKIKPLITTKGRMCTNEEIERYHTQRVNQMMNDCEQMTTDQLMDLSTKYDR